MSSGDRYAYRRHCLLLTVGIFVQWGVVFGVAQVEAQTVGTLTGTVVSQDDEVALRNPVIVVEGTAQRTIGGTAGRFRVEGVTAGRVTLVVQAPGFLELRVTDVEVQTGNNPSLIIELQPIPNYLETVQVTATKTPLGIGDVAAQTDVIDRTTIEARGDQELVQAIAHVPGVVVSTQAGSFQSVMLRGLPRDGNEFTSTLLMIDGVPQTDSRNSARVVNLPIHDAARVEVVRGPNSSLYGRTAVGGTVNVVTANPTPEHRFGFDVTAGGFGMAKGDARASGPIQDWGGYYISASSEQQSSFYTGPFNFGIDRTAVFAKLTFVPDQRSYGSISVNRVLSAQSTPTNVPIINGQLLTDIDPRFDRFRNVNVAGPNYRQNEGRVTANYTRMLSPWATAHVVLGYRALQYKFIDDGDVIGSPFNLDANTLTMYPFEMQTDEDITYSEARVDIKPLLWGLPNTLTVGLSHEWNGGFSAGHLMYTDADTFGWPLNYLNPIHPQKSEWEFFRFGGNDYNLGSTGAFAQFRIEPARRLIFDAGGRFDYFAIDNTLTFKTDRPVVKDSFEAFSPKASLTVRLFGLDKYGSDT